MNVRAMTPADIPHGLRLCRANNWNQLDDDWQFFLDRGGACLAEQDGAVLGSVAWLPFGDDFAWLSMMLVDPAARRSGIGSRLMEAALDALGDARVRLDATPAGEPLYRRFGFVGEYELARAQAAGPGVRSPRARPIAPGDLPAIVDRDRQVFGADRSALLCDLYRRAPDLAWTTGDAYCFGRPGFLRPQVGPLVAETPEGARELAAHCLAVHHGSEFFVDLPRRDDGLPFAIQRPFLRMCRGEVRRHGAPEQVFAITGPEFG